MNIGRNDSISSTKEKDFPNTPINETFLFSSERFNSGLFEEDTIIDSIDNANGLFACFRKKEPTLKEALESIDYENYTELSDVLLNKSKDKLKEIVTSGMDTEDIAVIFCYTFQWNEKRFGDGESPYKKLNNSLSIERSSKSIKKTRSFLFLLLKALRKLPRFVPENRTLYRGIRAQVQTKPDPKLPMRKPYAAGNEKTWWTFTSTSLNLEATQSFIGKNEGSLFMLCGETWGYDISLYSDFPDEKEILLEPERKLSITSVSRNEKVITVDAKILNTPLVLKDIIKVEKTVKIKERMSKNRASPKILRQENVTDNTVELSWDSVGDEASYQVSSRKTEGVMFFRRNALTLYKTKGNETNYTVEGLEQGTEYEFHVRCLFDDGMGEWSKKIVVKTKMSSPKNIKMNNNTWDSITLTWDVVENASRVPIVYKVEVKKEGENNVVYNVVETSFTKEGLLADTEYNFRLQATRGSDEGRWSDNIKKNVPRVPIPSNVSLNSATWDSITLSWDAVENSSKEPIIYKVEMKKKRENESSFNEVYNGTETSFTKERLLADTEYNFRIQTARGNEMSGWSNITKIKTTLAPPNNIIPNSNTWGSITLSWDAVENKSNEQIKYKVEIKKEGENENDFIEVYNGTETSFTKEGLLADTEYNFKIQTTRGDEMSGWSNITKIKTRLSAPNNIISKSATWDSVTLSWDADENASKEPVVYDVEVKKEGVVVGVFSTTETSFTKKGLLADTEYNFKIQTTRGDEMSELSDVIKMRTPKVPIPSNISLNSATWDSINLSWGAVENTSKEPIIYKVEMKEGDEDDKNDFIEVYNGTKQDSQRKGFLQTLNMDLRYRSRGEAK